MEDKSQTINNKKNKGLITATGKRKTAVARLFLYEKKGDFLINDKTLKDFAKTEESILDLKKPFHLVGLSHPESQLSGTIKVRGSGHSAQIGAIAHAFSRALATMSEGNRVILRKAGLLTRDSRMVERKKPYLRKARKAPQYSKR